MAARDQVISDSRRKLVSDDEIARCRDLQFATQSCWGGAYQYWRKEEWALVRKVMPFWMRLRTKVGYPSYAAGYEALAQRYTRMKFGKSVWMVDPLPEPVSLDIGDGEMVGTLMDIIYEAIFDRDERLGREPVHPSTRRALREGYNSGDWCWVKVKGSVTAVSADKARVARRLFDQVRSGERLMSQIEEFKQSTRSRGGSATHHRRRTS